MKSKISVNMGDSYKLGMDEVVGLEAELRKVFQPVIDALNEHTYWCTCEFEAAEYKSRDGFISNKGNCGGLMLNVGIPKCEEYNFSDVLEFGECDECSGETQCGYKGQECASEVDGHLDAHLRIWVKFEGLDDDGYMRFYINACGGNGDAPYFRVEYLKDIFEVEFRAKSLAGIKRAASKHIKGLVKVLRGGK